MLDYKYRVTLRLPIDVMLFEQNTSFTFCWYINVKDKTGHLVF